MKKILFLIFICTSLLTGCGNNFDIQEFENNINEHYKNLETINYEVSVITNISNKSQNFTLDFCYNFDKSDTITILKPDEVSGIIANIEKNDKNMKISFDNMQVETLMTENLGISPVDVTSFAIFDLQNKRAESIAINDDIKICYLDDKILKDIYLNSQTYDIMKIDVYVNNNLVISCNYS